MYKDKKVLVFGSFGFIGLNLIKKLMEEGAVITALDMASQRPLPSLKDLNYIQGNILDAKLIGELVNGQEVLFNLAGKSGPTNSFADPFADMETNCGGVLTVLEAVKEKNPDLKVVFPGSRLEFGRTEHLPVSEDHPMRPTSLYGIHKLTAEKYHLAYFDNFGVRSTVLRISNPYGPHLPQENPGYNIVNYFFDQVSNDKTIKIFGDGHQRRDYIYVEDLIDLFLEIGEDIKTEGQVYNVGSGQGTTFLSMAQTLISTVGKGQIEKVPWEKEQLKVETGDYITDIDKITRDTKWKPVTDIEGGIKKTLESKKDPFWIPTI